MKRSVVGPALLVLLLSAGAWGEIYQTTDEEGNTVFTDVPPNKESEVVDLPEANIADSVEPAPKPQTGNRPSETSTGGAQRQDTYTGDEQDDEDVYIIGGDDVDDALEAKRARERREEVLEGDGPHEVRKAPTPHRAPQIHRR